MKKLKIGLILFLIIFIENGNASSSTLDIGERLCYQIKIFGIKAGVQEIEVLESFRMGKDKLYHIKSITKSNPFFSLFYKVDNLIHTYIEEKSLLPRYIEMDINEGRKEYRAKIHLNQKSLKAKLIKEDKRNNFKIDLIDLKSKCFDVLSLIYYLRSFDLDLGREFEVGIFMEDKFIKVKIGIIKKEKIKVPYGEFISLLAKQEGGNIMVWFQDEKAHLPLRIRIKAKLGYIVADLERVEKILIK